MIVFAADDGGVMEFPDSLFIAASASCRVLLNSRAKAPWDAHRRDANASAGGAIRKGKKGCFLCKGWAEWGMRLWNVRLTPPCGFIVMVALAMGLTSSGASIVNLSMLDNSGVTGEAADAFEAGNSFVDSGLTFAISVATTLGNGTGSFSANSTTAGINSDGSGDSASALDLGETLTLTVTFSSQSVSSVVFKSLSLNGVGSANGNDAAFVTVAGGSTVTLETGVTDFNGSSDVWTPNGGITLSSGDTIVLSAENTMAMEGASFEVSPVPEPGHIGVLSLALLAPLLLHRARRRR